jgi:hypothetical protein
MSAGCCMRSRRPCRAPAGCACPRAPTISGTETFSNVCETQPYWASFVYIMPHGTSAGAQTGWEERARAVPAGIKAPAVVAAVQRAVLDAPLCAHVGRVT